MNLDVKEERFNRILTLEDGRRVSFAEAGDPHGMPVFMLYGLGCSRYFVLYYDEVGKDLGLRLICPDRPGRGYSDHCPDRRFETYADDLLHLADHLGLYYFGLWGYSAGGAHALACARDKRIAKRLIGRLVVVACWAPTDCPGVKPLHRLASSLPRGVLGAVASLLPASDLSNYALSSLRLGKADADQSDIDAETIRLGMIQQATRQGTKGFRDEVVMCCGTTGNFGFKYEEIDYPTRIYHGRCDKVVPLKTARYVANHLPDVKYFEIDQIDHQTIIARSLVEGTLMHLIEDITEDLQLVLPRIIRAKHNTVEMLLASPSPQPVDVK
mmetsp:Transcript_2973/g.9106  ORF Transcript_2973/g.9106 Transcript_2973/m.9106 type:complete len:327 (+) Transcript_2973:283-1263(+)|eukprot:CAMPEP_0198731606 /NCGR_PEP_ID=MMETSP1475-20131203/30904_1 /TAXON_ID= ORGANISM="Unidentified sp., Strain CCMP1999" /NCGR_SAMPLE_ID=MMETSP1475 /ASSEMBLY_ACC=CAM_ASM_001111 /LENGTH=326 /DNA_ID=CAMNT_0044494591 /DNA_START=230 /DNA_END=1210 /DNA_ORIENTATION=-